jgi:hypothetical protein
MSELQQAGNPSDKNSPGLFAPRQPESSGGIPVAAWGIAGLVIVVVVAVLIFVGRSKSVGAGNTVQPLAPYAESLPLSQLAMSESTNLSGGKYTYIDGHIRNTGTQTVTSVTVQVLFHNEEQMPPQLETLPLALIRTHQPYIDTQMVSAAPIKPGEDREFRLTFETIAGNWNYQMPEVHIIRVDSK